MTTPLSSIAATLNTTTLHNPTIWEPQHALPENQDHWDNQLNTLTKNQQETILNSITNSNDDTHKAILLTYLHLNPAFAAHHANRLITLTRHKENIHTLIRTALNTNHPLNPYAVTILTQHPITTITDNKADELIPGWEEINDPTTRETITTTINTNPTPTTASTLVFLYKGIHHITPHPETTPILNTLIRNIPKLNTLTSHQHYLISQDLNNDPNSEYLKRATNNIRIATTPNAIEEFQGFITKYTQPIKNKKHREQLTKKLTKHTQTRAGVATIGAVLGLGIFTYHNQPLQHAWVTTILNTGKTNEHLLEHAINHLATTQLPALHANLPNL